MGPPSRFSARLLTWYDAHRRDLPWRRTRDPWAVLVSEVMLQQTRVEAVRDKWQRFVQRYPRPAAFAAADDDELHAAWQGLGYYRRARLLRATAQVLVEHHGGQLPADASSLGDLPGIGDYTRGAVGSIAFGLPLPAVDGNVLRVVARHRGLTTPIATRATQATITATVTRWLDRSRPGDFNQALMELGALVCRPTSPACERCPVAADCRGRRQGRAEELPVRRPPPAPIRVHARVVVAAARGGLLALRIPAGEPNAGQFELPGPGLLQTVDAAELPARLWQRCRAHLEVGEALTTVEHAITNHRITVTAHAGSVRRRGRLEVRSPHDPEVPWTTASRKVLARLIPARPAQA